MAQLNLILGNETRALAYAQKSVQSDPRNTVALALLRDHDIQTGHVHDARKRYEQAYPELFSAQHSIGTADLHASIDLAALLQKTDGQEQGDRLLSAALKYIKNNPRIGMNGYGISDVAIYALQGNKQQALALI